METNLYTTTVAPMMKMLGAFSAVLEKGSAHAKSKQLEWQPAGMQETNLLNSHIIFNQFPLMRQVQLACDNAKGGAARMAGIEAPKHEDTEATFAELQTRIEKTLAFLKTIKPESIIGREDARVTMQFFPGKYLSAFDYATQYLMPNFYFHVVTAYDILRQNGADIGKGDYLHDVPWKAE